MKAGIGFAAKFFLVVLILLVPFFLLVPFYLTVVSYSARFLINLLADSPITYLAISRGHLSFVFGYQIPAFSLSFAIEAKTYTMADYQFHVVNMVPFIALMVATPGMALAKKTKMLFTGVGILFCSHSAGVILMFLVAVSEGVESGRFVASFIAALRNLLPFVLWIILAKREVFQGIASAARTKGS